MSSNTSYVFHVEILIEDKNNAAALAQLINKLNDAAFIDYKLISGIQIGNEIDKRKNNAASTKPVALKTDQSKFKDAKLDKTTTPSKASDKTDITAVPLKASDKDNSELSHGLDILQEYKQKNKLIRIIVNRGLGIKVSIPCRVLNIDEQQMIITVYHVDEKQVYTFRLTEIEDFIEG